MDYLAALTEAQCAAVCHQEGPLLILAGPGSGKTRVVTCRIAHLLHGGVHPYHLLALTFTNKAADEMRHRVEQLAPGNPVWISTFHRFCSRLLRRYAELVGLSENFTIYDAADSLKLLQAVLEDSATFVRRYTPAQIARAISTAKNELRSPDEFRETARTPLASVAAEIYPLYQQRLLASNAVDFDDLLVHTARLLRANPQLRADLDERYRFVLVDEYQDTNLAQYTIVRALSIDFPHISVTGDPDQSIYGWRGANIRNILEFERHYPNACVVRLEQNFRSTANILRVGDTLISNNIHRKQKSLFTDKPAGAPVQLVEYATGEAEAVSIASDIATEISAGRRRPRDVAVLYRTNALSRAFEHALRDHGVPYQIVNGVEFYQRKEIKDVLAYMTLANNPRNDLALLRIINTPPRGIGKKSVTLLRAYAQQHRLSLCESLREFPQRGSLTRRAGKSMTALADIVDVIRGMAGEPVEAVVGRILVETGYRELLKYSESEEDQQRLANIEELVTAARQFDEQFPEEGHLDGFLEQAALVNDTDNFEGHRDKVTLMTLHSAKGLEFPVVFIVACEQGILPHERSREDLMQLEEERRLLFVGITRSQERLQLSCSKARSYRGRRRTSIPSSFLMELPRAEMEFLSAGTGESWRDASLEYDLDDTFATFEDDLTWEEDQKPPSDARTRQPPRPRSRVTTAADMLAGSEEMEKPSAAPDEFELGMLVTHPEYGPGKVVSLSGKGGRRTGQIQFLHPPRECKFVLAQSRLQPVKSG